MRLPPRRRVDRDDRDLYDGKARSDRPKHDFGLELVPICANPERQRFRDRITSQSARSIAQRLSRKRREKEVRNPVAELVARRRTVTHQIPDSEHERARVDTSPQDGEGRRGGVLAVGIDSHRHRHPSLLSLAQPSSERRTFAAIVGVTNDQCTGIMGHHLRGVARAVVHDDDGNPELGAKAGDDRRQGRRGVERRDNRTRADHGVALHYPPMPVRLVVQEGPHEGVPILEMRRRARAMLDAVRMTSAELSIVLTGDAEIQELNRAYRGKNRPTDVLAFAQRDGPLAHLAGDILGDVVLSVPTARRQARAHRHNLVSELTMLLAHGILHLLGWDHDTPAKDKRMRLETARLCGASAEPGKSRKPATKRPHPEEHRPRRKSSRRSGT